MAEAHDRSNRELKRAGILPTPDSHAPDYLRKARELLALLPPGPKTERLGTEGLELGGKDDSVALFHFRLNDVEVLHLDVTRIILARQPRTPKKVGHGPREMLVRLADKLPLARRR